MQHVQLGELYLETPPGSCDPVTNANVQNDSNGANTLSAPRVNRRRLLRCLQYSNYY